VTRAEGRPALTGEDLAALEGVLARIGLSADDPSAAEESRWAHTARHEAVDSADASEDERYALSPRSTRGATRA
jgi:hypothetical protein